MVPVERGGGGRGKSTSVLYVKESLEKIGLSIGRPHVAGGSWFVSTVLVEALNWSSCAPLSRTKPYSHSHSRSHSVHVLCCVVWFVVAMEILTRRHRGDVRVAGLGEGGVHRVGAADVLHVRRDGDEGVDHLLRLDGATSSGGHPQRFRKAFSL